MDLHLIAFYIRWLLNSELILHTHIAPLSYYFVLLCCLEQWVTSFDGLWPFWQPITSLYCMLLVCLQVVNKRTLSPNRHVHVRETRNICSNNRNTYPCSLYFSMSFQILIVSMLRCCETMTFLIFDFHPRRFQVKFPTWFPSPDFHISSLYAQIWQLSPFDVYLFILFIYTWNQLIKQFTQQTFLTSAFSCTHSFVLFVVPK